MQINPIVEKDLKIKMRGWKSPLLVTLYLGFLGFLIFTFFFDSMYSTYNYFNPRIMTEAFNVIAAFQLGMIAIITPALTASAISGERERKTLDLLLCTDYSTLKIIIGKVVASIAHVLLLVTASLPIMSTVFLFGGVRISDIIILFVLYLATALMIASFGIFFSTIFKRSAVSMIATYIMIMFLFFGTLIAYIFYYVIVQRITDRAVADVSVWFLFGNPIFGLASIIDTGTSGLSSILNIRSFIGIVTSSRIGHWVINVIFDVIASITLISLSAWKIKPVKRYMFKLRKREHKVRGLRSDFDK